MSVLKMGQWSTDFVCNYIDENELQTRPKDSMTRFLSYALNKDPGIVALWICITKGVDTDASLWKLCGVRPEKLRRRQKYKGEFLNFNGERFCEECRMRNLSQRRIAALLGVSRPGIQDLFSNPWRKKRRTFIEACEDVLKLERGSLIL